MSAGHLKMECKGRWQAIHSPFEMITHHVNDVLNARVLLRAYAIAGLTAVPAARRALSPVRFRSVEKLRVQAAKPKRLRANKKRKNTHGFVNLRADPPSAGDKPRYHKRRQG